MNSNIAKHAELIARIRAERKVALAHLGPKAYAGILGVTVPQLRQLEQRAGTIAIVPWRKLSTPVLRSAFDAFLQGREVPARFCSRHGYSLTGFTAAMREMWPEEWAMATEEKRPEHRNLYKMGRDLERRTKIKLLAAGYFVVRSAASKTKVDLVAMRNGEVLLIQCKRSGALPPSEWNALLEIAEQTGGLPILVENPHHGRTNWWLLTEPKRGRGTGKKTPFPAPTPTPDADLDAITQSVLEEDDDSDGDDSDNDDCSPARRAYSNATATCS